jgi:hypothetical protein
MIKKIFLILIFFNVVIFAGSFSTFDERQEITQKIKNVIIQEESISRAYEAYILTNYRIPTFTDLKTANYLGTSFSSDLDTTNFNSFIITNLSLNHALKSNDLKNDLSLKSLYESDTFRDRTFFQNDKIYFSFDDEFARHLYFLIKGQNNSPILACTDVSSKKYCTENNHIYIYAEDTKSTLLMYYHKDKYKTGPFVITNNTTLYSNIEFTFIPKGIVLYDTDGKKYIKTTTSIMALK